MKRGVLILAAAAVLLATPLGIPGGIPGAIPATADPVAGDVFIPVQGDDQYLARDLLLFSKVHNAEGRIIGDVEDFIFNADNQVVGVVMGTGGFFGIGEKRVAVRLNALQIKHEDGRVVVSLPEATKEVLDSLPAFQRKQPPKSLLERAAERAAEFTDKSSVTAGDAYEKAKPALEKAKAAAKDAIEEAKPALEKAKDVAKGAYEGAKEALDKPAPAPEASPSPPAAPEPTSPPPESAPASPPPAP